MKPIQNDTPADALIVHTGALGDLICALTAIECFFSQITLDFCCQGHIIPLLKIVSNIRNVFDINHPKISSIFMSARFPEIEEWLMDYPSIFLFSFSQDWESCLSKYNHNIVRIPPRPPISETLHTSRFIINALHQNSLISRNNSENQTLILQNKTRSYTKSIDFRWKSVCIHPGSGSLFKNWPIERYVSLSKRLHQKGYSVGWVLGPAENPLMKILIQNNVNHDDIIQTNHIQMIMQYLKRSERFVGNDSGISHLAAYMGVDTTVIFGPSDIRRWRPIGTCVKTIPENKPVCAPCFEKGIRQCTHKKCLNDISVSQVLKKIED